MKKTHLSILNNTECERHTYICTGIRACEYLHPDLQNMEHTRLTKENWQKIIDLRKENSKDSKQMQANR